jgi:hypothetical protein
MNRAEHHLLQLSTQDDGQEDRYFIGRRINLDVNSIHWAIAKNIAGVEPILLKAIRWPRGDKATIAELFLIVCQYLLFGIAGGEGKPDTSVGVYRTCGSLEALCSWISANDRFKLLLGCSWGTRTRHYQ